MIPSEPTPLHALSDIPQWARAADDDSAVVLTTRVRIARNLAGEIFPGRMSTEDRMRMVRRSATAISHLDAAPEGVFLALPALTPNEVNVLVERRAISPQMAHDEKPRGVFVWTDADRAILVCEEDHIRLTEIVPGLAPQQAYDNLSPILDQLSNELPFEHTDELGFLTACPANLGAAVRTSLFCHLPGLVMTGGIESLASHVSDAGFTVRGFWGEGSEVLGNTFQLTDGPALSHQTSDMLSRIESLGRDVIEREAVARIELQTQKGIILKDKIARSLAILQSCRILSGEEVLALFSVMRLGIDLGMIEGVNRADISLLIYELGKAQLRWTLPGGSSVEVRQRHRADRARQVFSKARCVL
jgi:protein arginine kinase